MSGTLGIRKLTYVHDGVFGHLLRGSGQAVEGRLEIRVGVDLGN